MSQVSFSNPVVDSVAKVSDEVAVGEDLAFQDKWWKFERVVWVIFACIILLDLAGALGRGPLSKARKTNSDGTIRVQYERIARTGTPNIMRVTFGPQAVSGDKIHLFVSESVINELGAQRVIPSPESTIVGEGGLTYTFAASAHPVAVEFALQPSGPGRFPFRVQVQGAEPVQANVIVLP